MSTFGVASHSSNPSTKKTDAEEHKFEASLGYDTNLRQAANPHKCPRGHSSSQTLPSIVVALESRSRDFQRDMSGEI